MSSAGKLASDLEFHFMRVRAARALALTTLQVNWLRQVSKCTVQRTPVGLRLSSQLASSTFNPSGCQVRTHHLITCVLILSCWVCVVVIAYREKCELKHLIC